MGSEVPALRKNPQNGIGPAKFAAACAIAERCPVLGTYTGPQAWVHFGALGALGAKARCLLDLACAVSSGFLTPMDERLVQCSQQSNVSHLWWSCVHHLDWRVWRPAAWWPGVKMAGADLSGLGGDGGPCQPEACVGCWSMMYLRRRTHANVRPRASSPFQRIAHQARRSNERRLRCRRILKQAEIHSKRRLPQRLRKCPHLQSSHSKRGAKRLRRNPTLPSSASPEALPYSISFVTLVCAILRRYSPALHSSLCFTCAICCHRLFSRPLPIPPLGKPHHSHAPSPPPPLPHLGRPPSQGDCSETSLESLLLCLLACSRRP